MRIAVVAPPWYEVPPPGYGGIESICYSLVEGLTRRGHEVTLVGAGRDLTSARFEGTYPSPPRGLGEPVGGYLEMVHAARAARIVERLDVDIVHDHSAAGPLTVGSRLGPTLLTAHGPVSGFMGDYYRALDLPLVAISNAQRQTAPDLRWLTTVHNGIPVEAYPFRRDKEDFVLFLGRMNPDKGAHLAIDAARAAGRHLVIGGKCSEPQEKAYFEQEVRPRLGAGVEWIGEAYAARKKDLYARARCLLFPIQWDEPFGLVMIEAMACGTPVVALRGGSVDEVVEDGVTGFVLDDPADLPEAIEDADSLDPGLCRKHADAYFSVDAMVEGYEDVYTALLDRSSIESLVVPASAGAR